MNQIQGITMQLFDTHCHLQDSRIFGMLNTVINEAYLQNVAYMLCCGSTEDDWSLVESISCNNSDVKPAFGVHPWYVKDQSPNWELSLIDFISRNKHASVGEIGLDKSIPDRDDVMQYSFFVRQLDIAKAYQRPVSIHCRKAWQPLITAIKEVGDFTDIGGVIHSYSGPKELVQPLEKMGFYLSFSGSITNRTARKVKDAAKTVSLDRLCVETDAPDIAPFGWTKEHNEPSSLHLIVESLALLRGVAVETIAKATFDNARNVFKVDPISNSM